MKQVRYAIVHQEISALHSVVCIPDHYWGKGSEPEKGMLFELIASREKSSILGSHQPSRWRIDGPVWTINKEFNQLDAGCFSFFKTLWPVHDDWIKLDDKLYCFRATILEPRLSKIELAQKVGYELANRERL